jgi:AcrR family transcriptional regulator
MPPLVSYSDRDSTDGRSGMSSIDSSPDELASRPLRKDAARNRARLLQAAREVFAERGLEASLDDIAKRAGVGVGTAYRHFANKYELAEAIFAEAIDDIIALADAARDAPDPWDGLISFLEGAASAQTADRGLREVLMGVHDPEKMDEVNERISAPLRELVERAKKVGAVRDDVEATDIGIVVLMLCTVADVMGDVAPDLWRRYLPMLAGGLRSGAELPVPPVPEDVLRKAMNSYKERLMRAGQSGPHKP